MAYFSKHTAQRAEQQYLKNVKQLFVRVQKINEQLHSLLIAIDKKIDRTNYERMISYINQYIVHTDLWRLRFTNNLQNIEIAVLQIILLEHIFEQEHALNIMEFDSIEDYKAELITLNNHAAKLFDIHRDKMFNYIHANH